LTPVALTRRAFLGGMAGAAAGIALGACNTDSSTAPVTALPRPDAGARHRVVVVGAGLAGLVAATDVRDAGWEVVVLEARDRVGGRVRTLRDEFTDGLHAEVGGEAIDDNHDRIRARLAQLGLRTEERSTAREEAVIFRRGRRQSAASYVAGRSGEVGADYARYYDAIYRLGQGVDPEHPDRAARAEELDGRSLADLLDDLALVPEARFLVEAEESSEYNAEPSDLSLLFIAQQEAVVADVPGSAAETMRVHGGNDVLAAALAAALGEALHTGRPVTKVEHRADLARVHAGGAPVDAAHLVLALPPPPLSQIRFEPALPPSVAAVTGLALGPTTKVVTRYDRPFWRDQGLSGLTVADNGFDIAWDSADSYDTGGSGLLTAFTTGDDGAALSALDDRARIDRVQTLVDRVYPGSRDRRTGEAGTMAWAREAFTGGAYAAYAPGQLTAYWPVLRSASGPIRFAGEHTEALAGYMESAVRSGERVARALGPAPR
jgi:monoamine oxidase